MFKIGKLEKVINEKIDINLITISKNEYKKDTSEIFKTLSFVISGDNYLFSFCLNCKLEKLLKLPFNETIDFNNYILIGDTLLNINNLTEIDPELNIKITRYINNKFIIFLTFLTDYNDCYSGIIEFDFDLNDYLN